MRKLLILPLLGILSTSACAQDHAEIYKISVYSGGNLVRIFKCANYFQRTSGWSCYLLNGTEIEITGTVVAEPINNGDVL